MTTLPRWACLTRVWLEGHEAECHGRMGWVVAVTEWCRHGLDAWETAYVHEWLRRAPHTRNRPPYWHPPMAAYLP